MPAQDTVPPPLQQPDLGRNWRRASNCGLAFRPIENADLPFLTALYACTRQQELAHIPWTPEQKAAFFDMQFRAQHAHYQQHYPTAQWLLILLGNEPVGRVYLDRWPREHRLVDIALVPAHRSRGIGSALIEDLIEEAAAARKPLTIHVEKNNPARSLYDRLGFRAVDEHGVYDLLERRPA